MTEIRITVPTVEVQVGDETLTLRPFTVGQLPAVTRHLTAIASSISLDNINLPELLAEGGEDALAIMALACKRPRAWFDGIYEWDKAVEILAAIIELNREQFTKKVAPVLQAQMARLAPAQAPAEATNAEV